jgi:hypothetical protein
LETSQRTGPNPIEAARALSRMRLPDAEKILIASIPFNTDVLFDEYLTLLGGSEQSFATVLAMVQPERPAKERISAAGQLARCGPRGAKRAIDLVASDADLDVRSSAMSGFWRYWQREDVLPGSVLDAWMKLPEERLRAQAMQSTLMRAPFDAYPKLLALMITGLNDPSPVVRKLVLSTTVRIQDEAGKMELLRKFRILLKQEPDVEVRSAIAEEHFMINLQGLRNEAICVDACEALLAAVKDDPEPRVRAAAGHALARIIQSKQDGLMPRLEEQKKALFKILEQESEPKVVANVKKVFEAGDNYLNSNIDWTDPPAREQVPEKSGADDF